MTDYGAAARFFDVDKIDADFGSVARNIFTVDIDVGVDIVFAYYRKHGFPHYTMDASERWSTMKKLMAFDERELLVDSNNIQQTMHGLRLAWSYFPHWVDVRCGNSQYTPMEAFLDDTKFKEVIHKTWVWKLKHNESVWTDNRIRQNLKIYGSSQSVSNFRPSAAKFIYNQFGNAGTVWDMSFGWGGRLVGFLSSNCKHYIGTDPSTKTYMGECNLRDDFAYLGKEVDLHMIGSEVFVPDKNSLDLCFTSPPYFDVEKYADEETQSYNKFPKEDMWVNGFLRQTIENCHHGLKSGGHLILNIANTDKYSLIEKGAIDISLELGFDRLDDMGLILSSVAGKGIKTEPIYIFRKK